MQQKSFIITNKVGLHARPGALFVQTANKFTASVKVRNKTQNSALADGKSALGVLGLRVRQHDEIELLIEGEDEQAALDALTTLIDNTINAA